MPDVSTITITAGQHGRFLLSSDGLWDVLTIEAAMYIALTTRDPIIAAKKLARKACELRLQRGMKSDDITIIVVDVNPDNFIDLTTIDKCMATTCTIS